MVLVPSDFKLDEARFGKNLRSSKRGAAGGPSSMTTEHLRPLLDSPRDTHLLFDACQLLSTAKVLQKIKDAMRLGRMTALSKDDGDVRGIVAGDVLRRLTARTMAQQLGKAVEAATAPFQFALSTKAGCECVPHTLQALCEMNPEATVVSVDGIGAFDLVSRRAMLEGLHAIPGGAEALPFVRMFYGQPSRYLWEDCEGIVHAIHQGEGGEQGDALMPLLFSLGQHGALAAVQRQLHEGEKMFAYLDDIYIVTTPARVGDVYCLLLDALYRHAHIRLHCGKTQVRNSGGIRPEACDALERVARAENPRAVVWKGSDLPLREQGIKVLGTPLGHLEFVSAHLERTSAEHQVLLDRIPHVPDVQAAWLILLHCAGARANYLICVVSPDQVHGFAENHDSRLWACQCHILQIPEESGDQASRITATLPLVLGGCGVRGAARTSQSAFWASWADCLHMVHQRHAPVADLLVHQLESGSETPHLGAAVQAARALEGVQGFEVPSWRALALGHRPPQNLDELEIDAIRGGWQHEAASRVEREFRESVVFPSLADDEKALVRSQSGSGAGAALSTVPTHPLVRIDSQLFRVLLSRRLRLSLPLARRFCRCDRSIDVYGHHRAACARAGVLAKRGFALESAAARVCRKAGARVTTNVMVRDLDPGVMNVQDGRRLEVIADGLPLHGGAQLAVDTTIVSALHCDGTPHRGAANVDGVRLVAARRRKERTYPELVAPRSHCRLVVLANEVGGRWSTEALVFSRLLVRAKARSEPLLMRMRAQQAWKLRWLSILTCASARAVALSLLCLRSHGGADGAIPHLHEVEGDFRSTLIFLHHPRPKKKKTLTALH